MYFASNEEGIRNGSGSEGPTIDRWVGKTYQTGRVHGKHSATMPQGSEFELKNLMIIFEFCHFRVTPKKVGVKKIYISTIKITCCDSKYPRTT